MDFKYISYKKLGKAILFASHHLEEILPILLLWGLSYRSLLLAWTAGLNEQLSIHSGDDLLSQAIPSCYFEKATLNRGSNMSTLIEASIPLHVLFVIQR